MSKIIIDRWIDISSFEFMLIEDHKMIKSIVKRSIELKAIKTDKNGNLYDNENPIHAELNGKLVGLRCAELAAN